MYDVRVGGAMLASLILSVFLLFACRVAYVIWRMRSPHHSTRKRSFKTLIVLGSGGHTAELLNLIIALDKQRFSPRIYIAALTDNMSLSRASSLEETFMKDHQLAISGGPNMYKQIYRSREVGQSYATSVVTTIIALLHGFWIVFEVRPDIVFCNGPGTCIPICFAAFVLKVVSFKWVMIVYVESIARVRRLSLSGLILYKLRLAEQIYVQWPQLKQKFPRSKYVGRLM